MELPFSDKPGRRERHLRRRQSNALFAWPPIEVGLETLLAAQKADQEELESFRNAFRAQVQKAVDLQPNAGSDSLLALKEELEKLYEQACGLQEAHEQEKQALSRLIGLIMTAVRAAAGDDPLAHRELEDAEQARTIHFRLLEHPLVVDILYPESPIAEDELVPVLLGAEEKELKAALELFDADQLAWLLARGVELLNSLERMHVDTTIPHRRLALLEQVLSA